MLIEFKDYLKQHTQKITTLNEKVNGENNEEHSSEDRYLMRNVYDLYDRYQKSVM